MGTRLERGGEPGLIHVGIAKPLLGASLELRGTRGRETRRRRERRLRWRGTWDLSTAWDRRAENLAQRALRPRGGGHDLIEARGLRHASSRAEGLVGGAGTCSLGVVLHH